MIKQKIKICYIIGTLNQGGAERQFVELIKNIDKEKFEVYVLVYSQKEIFYTELLDCKDINLYLRDWSTNNKLLRLFEIRKIIKDFLNKNEFDIIHTTLFYNGIVVRLFAPKKYRERIISTIRNNMTLFSKTQIFIEKQLSKRSWVITNTKTTAEEFKQLLSKKRREYVSYIYNGFDVDRFSFHDDDNYKTKRNKNIRSLMVGRLTKQKNNIQVFRVFNSIDNKGLILDVYGEPHDTEDLLKNYIKINNLESKISLRGVVKDIHKVYPLYDIFILSSIFEGCPNVLFEALLAKRFCIISTQSNTDQFIVSGINGLVYNGTEDDLREKLQYAISIFQTKEYFEIVKNGFKYASQNFTLEKMVKAYEKFYFNIPGVKK